MLDDDAGRRRAVEGLHAFPGRVGVGDVVVGQLLALQLGVAGHAALGRAGLAVEGRGLVRVLAVAQVLHLVEGELQALGIGLQRHVAGLVGDERGEVVGDRRVVARGVGEGLHREREAGLVAELAGVGLELFDDAAVVLGVGDDADAALLVAVVLGRGAHHGGAADVDVLDRVFQRAVGLGHGLLEGVEIDHHQVDAADVVGGDGVHVFGEIAAGEDAAMHLRVQGLDPAVQHLGEAGVLGDVGHRQAGLAQQAGGAAGRQQLDAERGELAGEVEHATFVGDADQGLGHVHRWAGSGRMEEKGKHPLRAGRIRSACAAACCG
ncbi:MAG: hypothetical protein BWZ09_01451 [Alphaproteobacteria bacterium ADurb.BinA305]|nr:MAG: hypothetical protein BWZ09_01451 [Alphaproteobacteria bacterium ADurb.BinA305]